MDDEAPVEIPEKSAKTNKYEFLMFTNLMRDNESSNVTLQIKAPSHTEHLNFHVQIIKYTI